jgi:hypothetical protein
MAEQSGSIEGIVIDKTTQKPLAGAIIGSSGIFRVSDSSGYFIIDSLPPGNHLVSCAKHSYDSVIITAIMVFPNKPAVISIELEKQYVTLDTVVVHAKYYRTPNGASVSYSGLDQAQILNQPTGMYDIQRSLTIFPNVVMTNDLKNEIVVLGGNVGENLFVVDGVEIINPNALGSTNSSGGLASLINPQLIRKMDFYTGAFPARYGGKASSVLDITLRDGSREALHGKADCGIAGLALTLEGPLPKGSFVVTGLRSYLDLISPLLSSSYYALPTVSYINAKASVTLSPHQTISTILIAGNDSLRVGKKDEIWSRVNTTQQYAVGIIHRWFFRTGYLQTVISRTDHNFKETTIDSSSDSSYYSKYQYRSIEISRTRETNSTVKSELGIICFDNMDFLLGLKLTKKRDYFHYGDEQINNDIIQHYNPDSGYVLDQ